MKKKEEINDINDSNSVSCDTFYRHLKHGRCLGLIQFKGHRGHRGQRGHSCCYIINIIFFILFMMHRLMIINSLQSLSKTYSY